MKEFRLLVEEPQVSQRQNDESGHLEKPEERPSANGDGQHQSQSDTTSQPTELLPELDILAPSLNHGVGDLLFRSIGTELCQNLFSIDHRLPSSGHVAGESCQFCVEFCELIGQGRQLGENRCPSSWSRIRIAEGLSRGAHGHSKFRPLPRQFPQTRHIGGSLLKRWTDRVEL